MFDPVHVEWRAGLILQELCFLLFIVREVVRGSAALQRHSPDEQVTASVTPVP